MHRLEIEPTKEVKADLQKAAGRTEDHTRDDKDIHEIVGAWSHLAGSLRAFLPTFVQTTCGTPQMGYCSGRSIGARCLHERKYLRDWAKTLYFTLCGTHRSAGWLGPAEARLDAEAPENLTTVPFADAGVSLEVPQLQLVAR